MLARCSVTDAGHRRWKLRLDTSLCPDITVGVRLNAENTAPLDYYLLPWMDLGPGKLVLGETNPLILDGYRFEDLSMLRDMARRVSVRRVA